MATIGNINIGITASTRGLDKGFSDANTKLTQFARKRNQAGLSGGGGGTGGDKGTGGFIAASRGLLGPLAALLTGRTLIKTADQWAGINNQVKTVTDGVEDQEKTIGGLMKSAIRSRASFAGVASVFQQFAAVNRTMGISNDKTVRLTETLFKLGAIGGQSTETIQAGLRQLSQGFGKNRLDGDELKSVMENLLPVAQLLAQHMGVGIGELKELGSDGAITAQVMIDAFSSATDSVDERFRNLKPTISGTFENLKTQWLSLIGTIDKATAASDKATATLNATGNAMQVVQSAIEDPAKSNELQFVDDVLTKMSDNPVTRTLKALGNLHAETGAKAFGTDPASFFGPQNPITTGKITEENSKEMLEQMRRTADAVSKMENTLFKAGYV